MSKKVRLKDAPPGLFLWNGVLCFKSEYTMCGTCPEAFVVESGEYFWGDAKMHSERSQLMVEPVTIEDLLPDAHKPETDVVYNPVERAYVLLKEALNGSDDDLSPTALEAVLGYLGEALDDHPEPKEQEIIAVDFDGTLCENKWPGIGAPNFELLTYLKSRQFHGAKLILWTCRTGDRLKEAVEWCDEYALIFDAVNEDIPDVIGEYGPSGRKVFATEYIDDRASTKFKLPFVKGE